MKRYPHPSYLDTDDILEFSTGHQVQIPRWNHPVKTEPVVVAESAASVVDDRMLAHQQIHADPHLSSAGREHKSQPIKQEIIGRVAASWSQVESYENHIDNREAALLALPVLDPTAAAVAIEDREIRDWWRALPAEERVRALAKIGDEPEEHQRLAIALLRSPIPLASLDGEVKFVREVWNAGRRAGNPSEAAAIGEGREGVEYAKRLIATTAAVATQFLDMKRDQIIDTVLMNTLETGTGYRAFGFGGEDVATAQRRIDARRHLIKTA